MNYIGIYHSADLDGLACAAIMKNKYPNIYLIGWDYGKDFGELQSLISEGAKDWDEYRIIMADLSLSMVDMETLDLSCDGLVWIDHHRSAIEEYATELDLEDGGSHFITERMLNENFSACELCWMCFYGGADIPQVIHLLGVYDTWRKGEAEVEIRGGWDAIMNFQIGMRHPDNYSIEVITELLESSFDENESINEISELGKQLRKQEGEANMRFIKSKSYEGILGGESCLVINGRGDSTFWERCFDNPDYDSYSLFIGWNYQGSKGNYKFSLRANNGRVDCSKIAKQYGGGGHKGAAGFEADTHKIFDYEL